MFSYNKMTEQKQISLQDAFKFQNQWLRKAIEIIEEDRKIITELVGIINSKSNSKLTIDKSKITYGTDGTDGTDGIDVIDGIDGTDEEFVKYKSYVNNINNSKFFTIDKSKITDVSDKQLNKHKKYTII